MANQKMPLEQAQGVAIRCIDKVGGQESELDDVLNTVGLPDAFSIKALRREIVHGDEGVKAEGYAMKTSDLASINPESTVDDVANKIHSKATPAKSKTKTKKSKSK